MSENNQSKFKPELRKRWLYRNYLLKLRQEAGLRIDALGEKLFLDKKIYYRIEQGERGHRMNALFIQKISKELGVSIETFINLEAEYQRERIKAGLVSAQWYVSSEEEYDDGD
jgi:transcriptional regulator with XRE-family HTH domain